MRKVRIGLPQYQTKGSVFNRDKFLEAERKRSELNRFKEPETPNTTRVTNTYIPNQEQIDNTFNFVNHVAAIKKQYPILSNTDAVKIAEFNRQEEDNRKYIQPAPFASKAQKHRDKLRVEHELIQENRKPFMETGISAIDYVNPFYLAKGVIDDLEDAKYNYKRYKAGEEGRGWASVGNMLNAGLVAGLPAIGSRAKIGQRYIENLLPMGVNSKMLNKVGTFNNINKLENDIAKSASEIVNKDIVKNGFLLDIKGFLSKYPKGKLTKDEVEA